MRVCVCTFVRVCVQFCQCMGAGTIPRFGQASSGANGRLKRATKQASFGCNPFRCPFPFLKYGRCNEQRAVAVSKTAV